MSAPGQPGSIDPALAALSSQPLPELEDEADAEVLAQAPPRGRRESLASSEYTSGTGNSVYGDAASQLSNGSQATITRSETGDSSDFHNANESASSHQLATPDSTMNYSSPPVSPAPVAVPTPTPGPPAVAPVAVAAQPDEAATPRAPAASTFDTASTVVPTARPTILPPAPSTESKRHDSTAPSSDFAEKTPAEKEEKAVVPAVASKKEKKSKKGKKKGDKSSDDEVIEDPELAHLSEEHRRIILEQVNVIKRPPVSFGGLFRFHTRFEIILNVIGIFFAIVAGAAQPLMTVVFGALTTSFTAYGTAQINVNRVPNGEALLAEAKAALFREVNKDCLYLVYIGIGMFVATFVYMASWIYTGETSTRRIREAYLRAVLRQNVSFHDKTGAGEVTARIETDSHLIQEGISDKIAISAMFIATFFTGFIVAFVRNWRLALAMSSIIPCIAIAGAVMNKFVSGYKQQMLEETAHGATLAEEVISSVRNTHAFGTQNKLTAMYDVSNLTTLQIGLKSATANGVGLGVFFFIIYGSYGLAFYFGTTLILSGHANSGQVINVFFSILIGAFSLAQIAPNMQALSFAVAAATSIFATIDRDPVIDSASPNGLKPESIVGDIALKDIDFIYPSRPAVQVLHKFTANFPHGKMTALVGGSGSGKSTIVGLIERFYDPVGGSVKIDGNEVKDLNVKWLRTQIGLVSQEPTLFATTVAGNIEHGLIGTKFEHEQGEERRARVIAAATQANADGFITALPLGYDTEIGERGMLLSGGQKQRIAIARAIIGDPQILLLDEATSALDTASEVIVQDALDRASAGRTTITIAHRLSTIKDADQIIVLTAGHILESAMTTESGTAHETLLRNADGAYSRLVNAQRFREQEEATVDDSSSETDVEKAPIPGELTREEIEERARNEKPQFETLKRTGTGRSAASEALEQKHQRDLESGALNPKEHSFIYLGLRMLKLNRDRWLDYILAFSSSVLIGCIYPIFAIVFGGVIGVFSLPTDNPADRSELRAGGDRYGLYCFIIAIVATIGIAIQNYYWGASAERLSRKLRIGAFSAILRQDIAYFDLDENSTGHLTSSIADWAQKVYGLFGVTAGVIIQSLFTLIAGAIVGLCYGWRVSLVGIACMPLTIAAGIVRLRVVVLKDVANKESHAESAAMACEAASAIRTVASLTREDDCCQIYSNYLEEPMRRSNRTAIFANAYYSLSQALSFFVIALIFWYGSHQLAEGALTPRTFFISLIAIIFGSIQAGNVFNFVPDMSKAKGAAAAYVQIVDTKPDIDAQDTSGDVLDQCSGHIKFNDVHFRYPTRPHVRVLRGLELEVLPGQFVAIVGPSGCGKSTLIQLVERFYDPLAGSVSVDGKDISDLNIQNYRSKVSLVSQEPTLYAGTVRFNITLGANVPEEQVSQADVEQACRDANIHDFVMSLPDGYNTEVGGKGTQLSGGQKQRIAIARALIRNPKILLLDEATSALDSESEKVVQAALDQAAKGRSTIAVAHRLSTIQAADVIYVLRDGKVAEKGKHFELLARKGIYYELVSQQSLEKAH